MEIQPGKLIAAIVLLVVAAGIFWFYGRQPSVLPSQYNFVCVETGESYVISKRDMKVIPAINPDTGKRTLLPVTEGEDGRIYISERYRLAIVDRLREENYWVDPRTFEVKNEAIR